MILPQNLQEKINKLYLSLNKKTLTQTQKNLTDKYKNRTGQSTSLIESKTDGLLYAISRMPATYSVIYTLFSDLTEQGFIENVELSLKSTINKWLSKIVVTKFKSSFKLEVKFLWFW